jgi:RNA polymerase sigma factor (sigma-70 family)
MLTAGKWSSSGSQTTLSTRELVYMLASGEGSPEAKESAFETIYHRYHPDLFRLIRSKLCARQDVRDIEADAQDIHADVWHFACIGIRAFIWREATTSQDPLKSWLFSIAVRKIYEYYRSIGASAVELVDDQLTYYETFDRPDHTDTPLGGQAGDKMQVEVNRLIRKAMSCLNPTEQQIIRLTHFANKTAPEIGAFLTISPDNVRVIRHRAIKKMQKFLQKAAEAEIA